MTDLGTEIFKRYGFLAIIFAIVGALCIWGLAHWAASPGAEVSVLWGLVKYTKAAPSQSTHTEATSVQYEQGQKQTLESRPDAVGSLAILVQGGLTEKTASQAIISLRSSSNLRELTAFESGKSISELPSGIFAFTLTSWMRDYPGDRFQQMVIRHTVDRLKTSNSFLEVQILADEGVCFVGFCNENDASRISKLSGSEEHKVVLSPIPLGELMTLVRIPIARIVSSSPREIQLSRIEYQNILDLRIK